MTYEQHVQEVAEEMARIHKGHLSSFDEPGYETKKYWTNWYLPYARVAVRLQAEAFRDAYLLSYGLLVVDERLNNMLIERGLIPAPEEAPFYCGGSEVASNDRCTNQCGICAKIQTYDHGTHH